MKFLVLVFLTCSAATAFSNRPPKPTDMLRGPGKVLAPLFRIDPNSDGTHTVRGPFGIQQKLKPNGRGGYEQTGSMKTNVPLCPNAFLQVGHKILTKRSSN